ncbi:MAG: amidohydrolase family protein [Motiliproteus sp.]
MRLLLALALSLSCSLIQAAPKPLVDCELHYVDFNQTTDGMERLFAAMDTAGVEVACIMGIPLQKSWQQDNPTRPLAYESDDGRVYYYSATDVLLARAVEALPADKRARLRPLISGFNPTDRNAFEHVKRMMQWYPGLWSGIGEILTRHDTLSHLLEGETPRADHPALMAVYHYAAEQDLTVVLHSNLTSTRKSKQMVYLHELQNALNSNPATRFVWSHAGTSANIERRQHLENHDETVQQLLQHHPNLSIGLSWTLLSHYATVDGQASKPWLALIERHPDRFVLGSDLVGRFGSLEKTLKPARELLRQLDDPAAQAVASGNALRLFPLNYIQKN